MSRHVVVTILIAFLFIAPGLYLTYYHSVEGDVPFVERGTSSDFLELATSFQIPASGSSSTKRREIRFRFPDQDPHWRVIDEQTNSGQFSLVILEEDKSRVGILATRASGKESLSAELRLTLERNEFDRDRIKKTDSIVSFSKNQRSEFRSWLFQRCGEPQEWNRSTLESCIPKMFRFVRDKKSDWLKQGLKDDETIGVRDFALALTDLFESAGFSARTGLAIPMKGFQFSVEPRFVLFLDTEDTVELAFDFRSERVESGRHYFTWGPHRDIVKSTKGIDKVKLTFATAAVPEKSHMLGGTEGDSPVLQYLSLHRLPLATQALFEFTLLLPLAALVICIVRNFIGVVTFGTFMPALLGLSFLQTGLLAGMVLAVLVIGAGCLARLAADRLHMLLVPRLAAVLTTVVILFYLFTQLSFQYSWSPGLQISLFPIVVLTMMVERLTLILDELGVVTALSRLTNTLISALLCYFVLVRPEIQYLFFNFPELNITVLGVCILFGRYTGYRLTELFRFREFGEGQESAA